MIKKIATKQLQPGMYVEDTGLTWHEQPYLFTHAGLIRDSQQVERIVEEGYLDVFIDTAKGFDVDRPGSPGYDDLVRREAETAQDGAAAGETNALEREMPEAKRIFTDSVRYAKSFMGDARLGRPIDFVESGNMVDAMIQSVSRNAAALLSLAKLRASDEYTFTHCINVSLLSVLFGRHLGLDRDALRLLGLAGLFHDLGKARMPEEVLNKPGKLTEEEFAVMRRHPAEGFLMMRQDKRIAQEVLRGALEHHEKFDGSGYPRNLSGDMISPFARIIGVADVYDALTSARVYKPGMPPNQALRIVYELKDSSFYPGHVEKFVKCLGIYPLGSFVKLSNGEYAVVVAVNPKNTLHPTIKIVCDAALRKTPPRTLDLAAEVAARGDGAPKILTCLDPRPLGVDLSGLDD
ncbi:MAG: HD-GYP domain-containing protein [Desulfovibrionaceae bacterium]|nr:HD-GYP domain-containing protein [Desulfovibrionaceae bacterium]MBF0514296.1 HD-GYP domain-containing protein [Desulfovibrionaceae bacterium]